MVGREGCGTEPARVRALITTFSRCPHRLGRRCARDGTHCRSWCPPSRPLRTPESTRNVFDKVDTGVRHTPGLTESGPCDDLSVPAGGFVGDEPVQHVHREPRDEHRRDHEGDLVEEDHVLDATTLWSRPPTIAGAVRRVGSAGREFRAPSRGPLVRTTASNPVPRAANHPGTPGGGSRCDHSGERSESGRRSRLDRLRDAGDENIRAERCGRAYSTISFFDVLARSSADCRAPRGLSSHPPAGADSGQRALRASGDRCHKYGLPPRDPCHVSARRGAQFSTSRSA